MAYLTPPARAHLIRIARIIVTALIAQPAIATLISSTAVRYPLVGAVIAAVEAISFALSTPVDVIVPGSRSAPPPVVTGPRTPPPV